VQVSRWLVGVKRLVQEVQNVEAPLSPSSDCHNDTLRLSSLCDVQPLPVPADCPTLVAAADCQLTGATVPGVSGNIDADNVTTQTTSVRKLSIVDVSPSSPSVTSHVDNEPVVMLVCGGNLPSQDLPPAFTSRLNVEDSVSRSPIETASSSHDEPDAVSASEMHVPCDSMVTSATSAADTATLNSANTVTLDS